MYLQNRDVLKISGDDRMQFLHKLCTSNIITMQKHDSRYACILSPQSRFFCDFFVYCNSISLLIDVNHKFTEMLINKLKFYKMRSNIDISITPFKIFIGDIACVSSKNPIASYQDPRSKALPSRIILDNINHLPDESDLYNDLLIKHSIVDGIWLEQDKAFILEYGFDKINAIDRNKGCYIGQELITRTQCTGVIRKSVRTIKIAKENNNTTNILHNNTNIIYNDIKIGHVITMDRYGIMGLVLIKNDYCLNKLDISNTTFNIF